MIAHLALCIALLASGPVPQESADAPYTAPKSGPVAALQLEGSGDQKEAPAKVHAFFVAGPTFTGIIDELGETRWAAPLAGARDGWVLPNGHILVVWANQVLEFGADKAVVWHYKLAAPNKELGTAQRLDNGNTLVTELGPAPRLREITPSGQVAVEVSLQPETDNAHMQTRMARKLPSGDYLVPHLLAHAVKRYSPKGEVTMTLASDRPELGGRPAENWPFTAIRLANGSTLVGCTHGNKVVEFGKDGKIVWDVDNEDLGGLIKDACGVQRLPNGNTVIASYAAKTGPKLIEVNPAKEVVWTYSGPHRVHHFQILTTNGEPLRGQPLK